MLTNEYICVIIIEKYRATMKCDKKTLCFGFANSVTALLLGLAIYLCFGENTYLNRLFNIRSLIDICSSLRYYIPDFLWAYSLAFMLTPFCGSVLSGVVSSGFGIIWEVMQMINVFNGTFDVVDIMMYITASSIAVLILLLFNRRKNYENDD